MQVHILLAASLLLSFKQFLNIFSLIVPMKAPVEKTHAFEVVHDKLTVSNGEG